MADHPTLGDKADGGDLMPSMPVRLVQSDDSPSDPVYIVNGLPASQAVLDYDYEEADYILGIGSDASGQLVKYGSRVPGVFTVAGFANCDRTGQAAADESWAAALAKAKAYADLYGSATIKLTPGVYRASQPWVVDRSVINVEGYGTGGYVNAFGSTIVPTEDFPDNAYVLEVFDAADPTDGNQVSNIRLSIYPGDTLQNTVHGLRFGGNHGDVTSVFINQLTGDGLVCDGSPNGIVEVDITGVQCRQLGGTAFRNQNDCSDFHYLACKGHGCGGYGLDTPGGGNIYTLCHWYNNLNNLFLGAGGSLSRFVICKFQGSAEHNVNLDATNGAATNLEFAACDFRNYAMSGAPGDWDVIRVWRQSGSNTVSGILADCILLTNPGHNLPNYYLNLLAAANNWIVHDNKFEDNAISAPIFKHANTRALIRRNLYAPDMGFMGAAAIASGTTSIVITHDLGYVPSPGDLHITPTNSPTNDPGHFWLSGIDNTQFTVNCRNDPGASGFNFEWKYH